VRPATIRVVGFIELNATLSVHEDGTVRAEIFDNNALIVVHDE
jgi:hypothetical protein